MFISVRISLLFPAIFAIAKAGRVNVWKGKMNASSLYLGIGAFAAYSCSSGYAFPCRRSCVFLKQTMNGEGRTSGLGGRVPESSTVRVSVCSFQKNFNHHTTFTQEFLLSFTFERK